MIVFCYINISRKRVGYFISKQAIFANHRTGSLPASAGFSSRPSG
jgi:hypothetical protein